MTKGSVYDWDGWLDEQIARFGTGKSVDPPRGPWRHRIARRVMIDLLYASGVRWAGWYGDKNLQDAYSAAFGRFMAGGFGPQRGKKLIKF